MKQGNNLLRKKLLIWVVKKVGKNHESCEWYANNV